MDSNKKHLNDGDLWKHTKSLFCATAGELLTKSIPLMKQHQPDMVLIHTGTNDLDVERDGATIARTLSQVVQRMKETLPQLKIVVSEVTPRKVNYDDQVKICNEHLHTYLDHVEHVTLAVHSNLRTRDWRFYDDDKHISQSSIRKLASNLKTALRTALGIPQRPREAKSQHKKTLTIDELKSQMTNVMKGGNVEELKRNMMNLLKGK